MTSQLDKDNLPEHIAIIMDGNGRWAKAKNRPRLFGHNAGMKTLKKIVRASSDVGIKIITMYAFSTENWKRSPEEVTGLMNIAVEYFHKEVGELHENNVKINVIGDMNGLTKKVREAAVKAMDTTAKNTGLVLNIALNYGSRDEIVQAVKGLMALGISPEAVSEAQISAHLYTKGQPDPDLLIRTGGESRLSNFMLWQMAYCEFMFTDIYWPDFEVANYYEMIANYQRRNRRYGSAE
ncbi:isoprenyl transferase [Acetobacterium carbinolicum]|jgi:undecaprenyl diphosphate synthase|uniref:isoprenyl transferase n=1 Tax=Acetobacterium TaxID=33951 RepID=UPI000DBEC982|nr:MULTISPECIES: isoprenyl transferase [unclassified Acetobacterium]AWW26453.1 isoprenyl transferase [Acetobacterium sp. KB-1]MDZ5724835.1 isoprenyl transferase [Acetobacterium sp. K1/6]